MWLLLQAKNRTEYIRLVGKPCTVRPQGPTTMATEGGARQRRTRQEAARGSCEARSRFRMFNALFAQKWRLASGQTKSLGWMRKPRHTDSAHCSRDREHYTSGVGKRRLGARASIPFFASGRKQASTSKKKGVNRQTCEPYPGCPSHAWAPILKNGR